MNEHHDTPAAVAAEHLRGAARQSDDAATRELRERLAPLLAGFELGPRLGRGGMGVVFRAHQTRLGRDVAIKVLVPPPGDATDWSERFQREAQALAKLSHPGIVTIHDFGQADGLAWIVMEAIEGTSLRDLLNGSALSPEEALAIAPGICAALQYAHDQGVVHRDVKPENVLIDMDGNVKLVDFGLAKLAPMDGDVLLTRSDQAMGTLRYMAPEQLDEPRSVDHRADIFSLGVVLYEMLTGIVPQGVIEPPSKRVDVDVRIDEVVLRSLEREPERRYQHVSEVRDRVEAIRATSGERPAEKAGEAAVARMTALVTSDKARQPGVVFDGALLFLIIVLFASVGSEIGAMQGLNWRLIRLSIPMLITVSAPLAIGAFASAKSSRISMPVVRMVAGLSTGCALTLVIGRHLETLWQNAESPAVAVWYDLAFGTVLIALAQCMGAALTSEGPMRRTWPEPMQELFRWTGGAFCMACACLALVPWTAGYSLAQVLVGLGFLGLAFNTLPSHAGWTQARAASFRARAFAVGGVVGLILTKVAAMTGGSLLMDNKIYMRNVMLACMALTVLGGIAGAGSPRLGRVPSGE